MESNNDQYQYTPEFEKQLTQLFIDVPGITEANGKYTVSMEAPEDGSKLKIIFGVKEGVTGFSKVKKILNDYIDCASNAGVDGMLVDKKLGSVTVDNIGQLVEVLNNYLETNPNNLNKEKLDSLGGMISDIYHANTVENNNGGLNKSNYNKLSLQMLHLMKCLPKVLWGIQNYTALGQVTADFQTEIIFTINEDDGSNTDSKCINELNNTLKALSDHNPTACYYNLEKDRYVFVNAQEVYNFMSHYLTKFETDPDLKVRGNAEIAEHTLDSIFDDFVTPVQLTDVGAFKHPKSVNAILKGLGAFVDLFTGSDGFYLYAYEEEGRYEFRIGCSEINGTEKSENKNEILEYIYASLCDNYGNSKNLILGMLRGEDNIEINTQDLRDLLPLLTNLFEEYNIGGPENIEAKARNHDGSYDHDSAVKFQKKLLKSIPNSLDEGTILGGVPMKIYSSVDAAKAAFVLASQVPSSISLSEIEATIYQEYEGYVGLKKAITTKAKAFTVH